MPPSNRRALGQVVIEATPIRCGHCGAPVAASDARSVLRCPYCGNVLERPAAAAAPVPQQGSGELPERHAADLALRYDIDDGADADWKAAATLLQSRPRVSNRWLTSLRAKLEASEEELAASGDRRSEATLAVACRFVCQARSLAYGLLARSGVDQAMEVLARGDRRLNADSALRKLIRCDLSFCQVVRGSLEAAARLLDSSDGVARNSAQYRIAQAWIALARGQPSEVLKWLGTGATEDLGPLTDGFESAVVAILRGTAFERLGRPEKAIGILEEEARTTYRWVEWLRGLVPQFDLCTVSLPHLARTARRQTALTAVANACIFAALAMMLSLAIGALTVAVRDCSAGSEELDLDPK